MSIWMYVRTNGYDEVVKIDGNEAHVLTETLDFPNFQRFDSEEEELAAIEKFMDEVIDWDCSDEWEVFPADETLAYINGIYDYNKYCWKIYPSDILWEKET